MQQFVLFRYKMFYFFVRWRMDGFMEKLADPRLDATRNRALEVALQLLETKGVLAVTHGSVSRGTGISRSTLYRHWPKLQDLRNATFARATRGGTTPKQTDGPLRADLKWILGTLISALQESPWGKIAPQVIGTAAVDEQTRDLLHQWIQARSENVRTAFDLATERGEIKKDAPIDQLIEIAISVPYFRKCMSGQSLDADWFDRHVDMICELAGANS